MTTLQTNRATAAGFEPAPSLDGIEWATPGVAAPADPRLDPAPTPEPISAARRLSPIAAISSLRQAMGARHARRVAARPELESIFPAGHPGFELRHTDGESRSALVAPAAAPAPVATSHEADLIAFDFAS